jgi:hypothetical protein
MKAFISVRTLLAAVGALRTMADPVAAGVSPE